MPWYILKQPDGRFAAFSSVVDNFEMCDAELDEALDYCRDRMGRYEAAAKVDRGANDEPLENLGAPSAADGLNRWRRSLETVALIHGAAALRATLARFEGLDEAARGGWAREALAALPAGEVRP